MRKNPIIFICAIILTVAIICSGCNALLQELEDAEVRKSTETMLNSLIANDPQTAYSLVKNICTEDDFRPIFAQMEGLLKDVNSYQLKLLSIHTNSTISNGQKIRSISSVYEMTTEDNRIIVTIGMDDEIGINSFYVAPHENTDYYYTGTLNNMKDATGLQWVLLLLNIITIGLSVFAIVDCCRHKIQKKALWILVSILGFFSIAVTISYVKLNFNFNLGWIFAYSALIRYGSGTITFRLMVPVGAIIYFAMRNTLLKRNDTTVPAPNNDGNTTLS